VLLKGKGDELRYSSRLREDEGAVMVVIVW
jgi:hypothetical protein